MPDTARYWSMPREQFSYSETPPLFTQLEELARQSGVSRGRAFEDWLTAMVCALAAETKEQDYLTTVERHKHGEPGRRGVDRITNCDLSGSGGDG